MHISTAHLETHLVIDGAPNQSRATVDDVLNDCNLCKEVVILNELLGIGLLVAVDEVEDACDAEEDGPKQVELLCADNVLGGHTVEVRLLLC